MILPIIFLLGLAAYLFLSVQDGHRDVC